MSIEKQKLYNEIETLPREFIIKSKKDLKEKLPKGFDDIKENKVYSLEEVFAKIDNM